MGSKDKSKGKNAKNWEIEKIQCVDDIVYHSIKGEIKHEKRSYD